MKIAIAGDKFMPSSIFEAAIRRVCGDIEIRTLDVFPLETTRPVDRQSHDLSALDEYVGDPDQLMSLLEGAEAFVTQMAPLSESMISQLSDLRLVAVARGGPVNVDVKAANQHSIKVVNTPGRNATAVAEFTIGAIISQCRNIIRGHDGLRRGEFRRCYYEYDKVGTELREMTVGVVGYGHLGKLVVDLLKAFGASIVVTDPFATVTDADRAYGVCQLSLDDLLAVSDVVTLHQRVTAETRGMFNRDVISRLKPGAVLVNTARGSLVDYAALEEYLDNGHLSGAVIETFPIEPINPDWPLLRSPNVTLTPHIAGASRLTANRAAETLAEEVRRWICGEPNLNII